MQVSVLLWLLTLPLGWTSSAPDPWETFSSVFQTLFPSADLVIGGDPVLISELREQGTTEDVILAPLHALHVCRRRSEDADLFGPLQEASLVFYANEGIRLPPEARPLLNFAFEHDAVLEKLNKLAGFAIDRLDQPVKHLYVLGLMRRRIQLFWSANQAVFAAILEHIKRFVAHQDAIRRQSGLTRVLTNNFFENVPQIIYGEGHPEYPEALWRALTFTFPSLGDVSAPVFAPGLSRPEAVSSGGFRLVLVNDGKFAEEKIDDKVLSIARLAAKYVVDLAIVCEGSTRLGQTKELEWVSGSHRLKFTSPKSPGSWLEGGVAFLRPQSQSETHLQTQVGLAENRVSVGCAAIPLAGDDGVVLVVGVYLQPLSGDSLGRGKAVVMHAWEKIANLLTRIYQPGKVFKPVVGTVLAGDLNAVSGKSLRQMLDFALSLLDMRLVSPKGLVTFKSRSGNEADLDLIFASPSVQLDRIETDRREDQHHHFAVIADLKVRLPHRRPPDVRALVDFSTRCLTECRDVSLECVLITCGRDLPPDDTTAWNFRLLRDGVIPKLHLNRKFIYKFPLPPVPPLPRDFRIRSLGITREELVDAWAELSACGNKCHSLPPGLFANDFQTSSELVDILHHSLQQAADSPEFPDFFSAHILSHVFIKRISAVVQQAAPAIFENMYGWRQNGAENDELQLAIYANAFLSGLREDQRAGISVIVDSSTHHLSRAFRFLQTLRIPDPIWLPTVHASEVMTAYSPTAWFARYLGALGVSLFSQEFVRSLWLNSLASQRRAFEEAQQIPVLVLGWSEGFVVLCQHKSHCSMPSYQTLHSFGVNPDKITSYGVDSTDSVEVGSTEFIALPQGVQLRFGKRLTYNGGQAVLESWFDHKLFWLPRRDVADRSSMLMYFTKFALDDILKRVAATATTYSDLSKAWSEVLTAISEFRITKTEHNTLLRKCLLSVHFLLHPLTRLRLIKAAMQRRALTRTHSKHLRAPSGAEDVDDNTWVLTAVEIAYRQEEDEFDAREATKHFELDYKFEFDRLARKRTSSGAPSRTSTGSASSVVGSLNSMFDAVEDEKSESRQEATLHALSSSSARSMQQRELTTETQEAAEFTVDSDTDEDAVEVSIEDLDLQPVMQTSFTSGTPGRGAPTENKAPRFTPLKTHLLEHGQTSTRTPPTKLGKSADVGLNRVVRDMEELLLDILQS